MDSTPTAPAKQTYADPRGARLAAIADAAQARKLLGQAAQHAMLPDGRHQVQLYDRAAGRLRIGTGATVAEAIRNMRMEASGK
jgi:hypothetical protein